MDDGIPGGDVPVELLRGKARRHCGRAAAREREGGDDGQTGAKWQLALPVAVADFISPVSSRTEDEEEGDGGGEFKEGR